MWHSHRIHHVHLNSMIRSFEFSLQLFFWQRDNFQPGPSQTSTEFDFMNNSSKLAAAVKLALLRKSFFFGKLAKLSLVRKKFFFPASFQRELLKLLGHYKAAIVRILPSSQDPYRILPGSCGDILAGSWQDSLWRTHTISCGTRPAPPQICMYLGQIWKVLIFFFDLRSMTRDNHTGMVKFYGSKSFGNILVKTSKSCQDPAEACPLVFTTERVWV